MFRGHFYKTGRSVCHASPLVLILSFYRKVVVLGNTAVDSKVTLTVFLLGPERDVLVGFLGNAVLFPLVGLGALSVGLASCRWENKEVHLLHMLRFITAIPGANFIVLLTGKQLVVLTIVEQFN